MSIVKTTIFSPYFSNNNNQTNILYCSYDQNSHGSLFFTEKESKIYKNLVNSLLNQIPKSSLNGKIYLSKLSSLPRHKIKDYFKKNNVNKTSRLDQSDTIILNKEHLVEFNEIFKSGLGWHRLKLRKVYKFDSKSDKDFIIKFSQINMSKIDYNNSFTILIDNNSKCITSIQFLNFLQSKESEDLYYKSLYRSKNLIEVHNYLEYILKNPNVKVIFDEDIMEPLNEDGFELDEEYLTTLNNMFESKSQDNINLALEMLSNINIEKNSLTIALFLNKHKGKFSWGSGLSLNNNNSFKSTLKYFKSKNIDFESDWRMFSTSLYKLHKDNPKNLEIINEFIKQNINMYLKEYDKLSYIELVDYSLALKD